MTPSEKTQIYSDYMNSVPTRTPQKVKDTIVKLASIMFEAEDPTAEPEVEPETAVETPATPTEDNPVEKINQIIGIDELFNEVGNVPADALEAKLQERLDTVLNTIPINKIDISSVAEKIKSAKQSYNIQIVEANEAANKARDEYNEAQRTLDENKPSDWDKLHELQQNARQCAKELKSLRGKLDTINKVFDLSDFNRALSEKKTVQQSFELRSKEDELRKQREEYYADQHPSRIPTEKSSDSQETKAPVFNPSTSVKAIQETLVRMVANKAVRESYNNMIASIKKANGERKQLRSTDPSADVKAIRAASFSEGTLVDNGVCSCYKLGGADNAPTFPVFPFSELFGANPKAIVSYDEGANLLSIKERTLNMSDGTQRPGSWEIQITADESGAYADVSVPNDPKNPADGYNMVNAVSADLASLNVRGARPKFLSDAFNELAKNNPRMQV